MRFYSISLERFKRGRIWIGFAKGYVFGVANYYPGGNFNMDTSFKQQILKPIQKEEKDTKDLFELEKVREN